MLKVGDLVTTSYRHNESKLVRKITDIHKDKACGSGFRASADGGEVCPQCLRPFTVSINGVDSHWFKPISDKVSKKPRNIIKTMLRKLIYSKFSIYPCC